MTSARCGLYFHIGKHTAYYNKENGFILVLLSWFNQRFPNPPQKCFGRWDLDISFSNWKPYPLIVIINLVSS